MTARRTAKQVASQKKASLASAKKRAQGVKKKESLVTLYHRSTPHAIESIVKEQQFKPKHMSGKVFFAGQANSSFVQANGPAMVSVRVRKSLVTQTSNFKYESGPKKGKTAYSTFTADPSALKGVKIRRVL